MGALSEAYRDNPLNLHQIVPLDFGSVQTVPDSHDWADQKSDDHHYSSAVPVSVPPVIELTDPGAPELIREACEKWGMFQLTGHGVPEKLMEDVEAETRRLFGLSADQKLKALRSPGGASGYGLPQISHFFSKRMWHEGFTIIGSPVHHAKLLWPHHYQPFCETIEDYQIQMKLLAEQLIRIILKSFEEAANWFETTTKDESAEGGSNSSSACNIALQMNSYPACPDPTRTMGLAPHTDTSLMTIVQQTKISGLQIFKEGVGWVLVQPVPGALTVNLGDFLHILSNGRFASIRHRVLVSPIQRTSVAFFYSPPTDFVVSPLLSKDSGPGQVSRYRSVTVKEYVNIKAKHLQNSLSFIET